MCLEHIQINRVSNLTFPTLAHILSCWVRNVTQFMDMCSFANASMSFNLTLHKRSSSRKRLALDGYAELVQINAHLTCGAFYQVEKLEGFAREIWICPVTLTVLGRYPRFIYVKKD